MRIRDGYERGKHGWCLCVDGIRKFVLYMVRYIIHVVVAAFGLVGRSNLLGASDCLD